MSRHASGVTASRSRSLPVLVSALALGCGERPSPPSGGEAENTAALKRADELAGRHRVAEALAEVEGALERSKKEDTPLRRELLARRGTLLLSLSRPDDAVRTLEDAQLPGPGGTGAARWLGQAYLESGEPSKAVEIFAKLRGKDFLDCLSDHGTALVAAGKKAEGLHAIAAGLVHDPWKDTAYLAFGRALVRDGREVEAGPFLERFRAGEPFRHEMDEALGLEYRGDDGRALLTRAKAERARGRLFEAVELCHAALVKKPDLGEAVLELARISIFLSRPEDALEVLRKLPRDPRALAVRGEAEEEAGDLDAAAASHQEALAKEPGLAPAAEGLRRIEARRRGEDAADPKSAGVHAIRRTARERMRGKLLSRSAGDLLYLAEGLAASGLEREARALSLFLLRAGPPERDSVLAAVGIHDEPGEAFIRLSLLERLKGPEAEDRFRTEAARLRLDPDALREVLKRGL